MAHSAGGVLRGATLVHSGQSVKTLAIDGLKGVIPISFLSNYF